MTAETTSRRNAPPANGGYADTASGDGREAEWTRQKNERPLPSRTQPQDAASWHGGTTVRTAQAGTAAPKDAKDLNASGGVRVSGSEQDIALFCKQIKETSGLDVKVVNGKLTITGGDPAKGNKAVAKAIREAVDSKAGFEIKLEKDTAVVGDLFVNDTLDIGDIQIALQANTNLAGSLLTHIFVERTYAAGHSGKSSFGPAHEVAVERDGEVFCGPKGCAPGSATLNQHGTDAYRRIHRVYKDTDGKVVYDVILEQTKTADGKYVFSVTSK